MLFVSCYHNSHKVSLMKRFVHVINWVPGDNNKLWFKAFKGKSDLSVLKVRISTLKEMITLYSPLLIFSGSDTSIWNIEPWSCIPYCSQHLADFPQLTYHTTTKPIAMCTKVKTVPSVDERKRPDMMSELDCHISERWSILANRGFGGMNRGMV